MPEHNPNTNQPTVSIGRQTTVAQEKTADGQAKKKKSAIKQQRRLLINIAIFGTINLICVFILLLLLNRLPQRAEDLKKLRNLNIQTATQLDTESLKFEIVNSRNKIDKLSALFPDETGLLEFIKKIDELKKEDVVTQFSFASNDPVKDKTGFLGLPIIIEFKGSWPQVDLALKRVEGLPFLTRAISIKVRSTNEDLISLRYGGMLYVAESFNSN